MIAATKQTKRTVKPKRTAKKVGTPIERTRAYTMAQLRDSLAVSRTTIFRYITKLGMKRFISQTGGSAQITGEQYFAWLDWLRQESKAQ